MAGYAAGFSGLESFSPFCLFRLPLAASFSRTVYLSSHSRASSLSRAVSLNGARKSGRGNRERERRREKQVVRGFSVRETVQPPFNIVGAAPLPPPPAPCRDQGDERTVAPLLHPRSF